MGRLLLLAALILALGGAYLLWNTDEPGPAVDSAEGPATIGRLWSDRERDARPGTVLPKPGSSSPRAAFEPQPLDAPETTGSTAAVESSLPMRSISGVVLRASDSSPLSGLRVRVSPADAQPIEVQTLEDPPGTFTLSGVPQDLDSLTLISTGPWPERRATHAIEPGPDDLVDLVLHFDSGFAVAGLVTDQNDPPIPEATVDAERRHEGVANATGRFFLPDIAPDASTETVEIGARAPWYQRATEAVVVPLDPSGVPNVHIRLVGSGALEGRLTDGADKPLLGGTVRLAFLMTTEHGSSATAGLDATSAESGRYRIDHVPPGRYIVEAKPVDVSILPNTGTVSNLARLVAELVPIWIVDVRVVLGEATQLDIALPLNATVSGRITDSYGTPLPDVTLLLEKQVRWPARSFSRPPTRWAST